MSVHCCFCLTITDCVVLIFVFLQQDDERIIQEIQKEGEAELNKKNNQTGEGLFT